LRVSRRPDDYPAVGVVPEETVSKNESSGVRKVFRKYLEALSVAAQHQDATEGTFYPPLKTLVENLATLLGHRKIVVVSQPRAVDGNMPDFRVWDGNTKVIGYTEAKPPNPRLAGTSP